MTTHRLKVLIKYADALMDGTKTFEVRKNDRGYEWWTTDGKLVLEDPEYCASVAFTVGSWVEMLTKYITT